MRIIFVIVTILASIAGAICGIGGGFIIKPVMDAFNLYSSATISFMSSVIVLCMTCYSLINAKVTHNFLIDKKTTPFLGIGAAVGGVFGKLLFDVVRNASGNESFVTALQSLLLMLLTIFTLIYNLNKPKVHTKNMSGFFLCIILGLVLGLVSSFLGIGGGPINLVLLHYCFSEKTKVAVQNSLFMVFLCQLASVLYTIFSGNLPQIPVVLLIVMCAAGVLGGILGRAINKKIDDKAVDKLFTAMMVLIIIICVYNIITNTVLA